MKRLALALGASVLALSATSGAQALELKLSYWVPPVHPLTPGYKDWANDVKAKTNGRVTITLYPTSQLGSGRDHYDMVKRGIADIGLINPGYTPGRFPVIDGMNLPFMISDSMRAAPALTRWYAKYASKEMPDQVVCHVYTHDIGTIHSNKPIHVPDDVKGLKIRSANHVMSRWVTAVGGNPVQVPIMEAKETLKRGITDGITVTFGGVGPHSTFKFNEVTKYTLDTAVYMSGFTHGVNKRALNRMSSADREAFMTTCTGEYGAAVYKYWYEKDKKDQLEARALTDHIFYKPTDRELSLWRHSADSVYAAWREDVAKRGFDPGQVLAELKSELEKANALF